MNLRSLRFYMNRKNTLAVMALISGALASVHADEPIPHFYGISTVSNTVELAISNVSTGGTYYIERTSSLMETNWTEVGSFEGMVGATNWNEMISGSATSSFYRVVRDPYHSKVGQVAMLSELFHDVAGTVHIVNNRTIELRNFYYDGTGLEVVVFLSPNSDFYPGISVSENLLRATPYVNETLSITLPEGIDLDSVSYVSIWCIDIPVSFGDGMFQ
ncbi:DM13 domain-containing protein [Pontiellaceae bacterium B12219]|nr:DM13 domain-containing protein [Pontiellaceae bacterium B12219]